VVVGASPGAASGDELELLIREARARQRKRWLGAAAVAAVLAGGVLGISSIVGGKSAATTRRASDR
jgi:hypothetical protein